MRLASLNETAEHLGVHPRTVRRMVARGELVAYRVGPRAVRVDLDALALRPIVATAATRAGDHRSSR